MRAGVGRLSLRYRRGESHGKGVIAHLLHNKADEAVDAAGDVAVVLGDEAQLRGAHGVLHLQQADVREGEPPEHGQRMGLGKIVMARFWAATSTRKSHWEDSSTMLGSKPA